MRVGNNTRLLSMFGHFAILFMKGLSVYFWLIYLTFNENNDLT